MYNFSDILGNNQIVDHLRKAVLNKRLSHAYILSGPAGFGKGYLSNTFAKTLLCEAGGADPCGICPSCLAYDSGNNPDVIRLSPEKNGSISVEAVREKIAGSVQIRPYKYSNKVFIIEKACKMTVQAQNALLKVLEEPPSYCVFILCADNEGALLSTVLSRCAVMRLKPLRIDIISDYLQKIFPGTAPEKARFYGAFSAGGLGGAISLLKAQNDDAPDIFTLREKVLSALEGITIKSAAETLLSYKYFEEMKERLDDALYLTLTWYRDLAVFAGTGRNDFLLNLDIAGRIATEAGLLNPICIPDMFRAVESAGRSVAQNANFQLSIEVMLLKLKNQGKIPKLA